MTALLMNTPAKHRSPYHGGCAEIACLNKAFNANIDPTGGVFEVLNIGVSGNNKGHKTPKPPCKTCSYISDYLGIKSGYK
jgi:hypothetical protein